MRVVGRRRDKELVRCVDAGRGVVVVVVVSGLLRGAVQVLQCAALGLPLWAYWPISHEILTPKYYSAARWVPQRGTQVSLSPVSR